MNDRTVQKSHNAMQKKIEEIKIELIFYKLHFWNFISLKIGKTAPKNQNNSSSGQPAENHSMGHWLKTPSPY
jgi:hypothetical protein